MIWVPESLATKMVGDMIFSDKKVALHLHKGYISTWSRNRPGAGLNCDSRLP